MCGKAYYCSFDVSCLSGDRAKAYLICNSKTDKKSAPPGCKNVFILVPVAPALEDSEEQRREYTEQIIAHIEAVTGEDLHSDVMVRRSYSHRDFLSDYHAYCGTALGLSHTLRQTAVFRPSHRSKKVGGLYYTGQYTHKKGSKTYFNSSIFFPKRIRDRVFILYAFVRTADNFIDCIPQDAEGFYRFRESYRLSVSGYPSGDPVIDGFAVLSREGGSSRSGRRSWNTYTDRLK